MTQKRDAGGVGVMRKGNSRFVGRGSAKADGEMQVVFRVGLR